MGKARSNQDIVRAEAIRTIRKFLNVARSVPNEPQGKTAWALAQKRMAELGITLAQVDAAEVEEEEGRSLKLLPWEERIWGAVRRATVTLGKDPEEFFADLLERLWAVNEREEIRLRAFYLGRCGRREDIARMLGGWHFKQYERVWEEAVIEGSGLALQAEALTAETLPGHIAEVYGRTGPIPLPQGVVSWLINNRETPEEAGPYVVAAWQRYQIEVNLKESAAAVRATLPRLTGEPRRLEG